MALLHYNSVQHITRVIPSQQVSCTKTAIKLDNLYCVMSNSKLFIAINLTFSLRNTKLPLEFMIRRFLSEVVDDSFTTAAEHNAMYMKFSCHHEPVIGRLLLLYRQ